MADRKRPRGGDDDASDDPTDAEEANRQVNTPPENTQQKNPSQLLEFLYAGAGTPTRGAAARPGPLPEALAKAAAESLARCWAELAAADARGAEQNSSHC